MITRRTGIGLALAAVLSLSLTACSQGAPTTKAAAVTDPAPSAVRIGYFANFTHAPAIVGLERGTFQKALGSATTVTTSVFDAGPTETEALLSGSLDIGFIGPGPLVNAYAKSKAVRVIAGAAANGAALVVRRGITSTAGLKGATLATPKLANTQDIALRYYLKQHGLTTTLTGGGQVKIQPQANSDAVNAFKQGQLDGAWVPEPYATQLVAAGGHVLVDEKTLWKGSRFATTNVVVTTAFLDKYPGAVTKFLRALVDTVDAMNADPAAAQKVTNAAIQKITGTALPPAVLAAAWKNVIFTVDPVAGSLVEGAKHAEAVQLLDPSTSLTGLYDLAPLNAVLKSRGASPVAGP
jgi:NitT/TauT family transport system substrate-binding protein